MFRRIRARNPAVRTKSGLMLGLGETRGVAGHAFGPALRGL